MYEEPDLNRQDLDLAQVNVYIHLVQNLTGIKSFRLRVHYGRVAEDGSFQTVEERFNDEEIFFSEGKSECQINKYLDFEYLAGYNHLKIEINELNNEDSSKCDLLIDLRDLNANRFLKKHLHMRNEHIIDNLDSYRHPFSLCVCSFFLQTHTIR